MSRFVHSEDFDKVTSLPYMQKKKEGENENLLSFQQINMKTVYLNQKRKLMNRNWKQIPKEI
jgi:hypothetical protein